MNIPKIDPKLYWDKDKTFTRNITEWCIASIFGFIIAATLFMFISSGF